MKNKPLLIPFLALAFTLSLCPRAQAQNPDDILIIANNGVPETSLTLKELKSIFLKQRANWKSGGRINPINARAGTPIREEFQRKILDMDRASEDAFWQDQGIKGGITAPAQLSNTLKAVFSLSGSISYCYRKDFKKGTAKVLLVL